MSDNKEVLFGCVVIGGLLLVYIAMQQRSAKPAAAPVVHVGIGDIATVGGNGYWPCGSSKEALDELTKWALRRDKEEMVRVALKTRSTLVLPGRSVKVLDSGFGVRKVRLLAPGPLSGEECWIASEAVDR